MHDPTTPRPRDPVLEERFASALHATARAWRLGLDARLRNVGIGQSGWLAIAAIAKSTADLPQRAIAERLGVEAASMAAMLDRLESLGFVRRMPCRSDRRVKLVQLTASGRELYGEVQAQADGFRATVLAGVDPMQLEQATGLLVMLDGRIGHGLETLSAAARQGNDCITLAPSPCR